MNPPARKLVIGLELEPEGDPIAGTLTAAGGDATSFSGWVELVASLREAISAANSQHSPRKGADA